jgi:thiol:disulfide interchange protein DsbG
MDPKTDLPTRKRRALLRLAASLLVGHALAGCSKADSAPGSAAGTAAAATAADPLALAAGARGFSVGPATGAPTLYVFFDATCPHCARLWADSQRLLDRLRMVWIPVGLLRHGAEWGAAILAAGDPVAAMAANEAAVRAGRSDAPASPPPADAVTAVKANTDVFNRLGVQSVPAVVYRNAATGAAGIEVGYHPPEQIAALVGVR